MSLDDLVLKELKENWDMMSNAGAFVDGMLQQGISEGLATGRTVLVREGVLESYLLDTYSARKLGLASTHHAGRDGSGVSVTTTNLMLLPGKTTPQELIGSVKNGFYVTERRARLSSRGGDGSR